MYHPIIYFYGVDVKILSVCHHNSSVGGCVASNVIQQVNLSNNSNNHSPVLHGLVVGIWNEYLFKIKNVNILSYFTYTNADCEQLEHNGPVPRSAILYSVECRGLPFWIGRKPLGRRVFSVPPSWIVNASLTDLVSPFPWYLCSADIHKSLKLNFAHIYTKYYK